MKCLICSTETGSKRKTCSDRCRQRLSRSPFLSRTVTDETVTDETVTLPDSYGSPDCACQHCRINRANGNKHVINHGPNKPASRLAANELNRVPLPDDMDYDGVAA